MRLKYAAVFLAVCLIPCIRAEESQSGLEDGMILLQNNPLEEQTKVEKPTVRDNGNNVRTVLKSKKKQPLPGGGETTSRKQQWDKTTPVPPHSLAARIPPDYQDKWILWSPHRVADSMIGVRLPAAALSNDQSLFAFVETIGAAKGPFGSRIVLLNAHTWEIQKLITLDRQIEKIAFLNDTPFLAAVCAAQKVMGQPYGLSLIHLKNGKEEAFSPIPASLNGELLVDRKGRIFIPDSQNAQVRCFQKKDAGFQSQTITVKAPSKLALSPNGKFLAAANAEGSIEIFKTSDLRLLKTVKIPEKYPVSQILFLNNGEDFLCAPDPLSDLSSFVLRSAQVFELRGRSGGFNNLTGDGLTILHLKKVSGEIEYIDTESLQVKASVFPERTRPVTKSDPRTIFYLEATRLLAVLDNSGAFYLLYLPRDSKRFQKELIFSPVD